MKPPCQRGRCPSAKEGAGSTFMKCRNMRSPTYALGTVPRGRRVCRQYRIGQRHRLRRRPSMESEAVLREHRLFLAARPLTRRLRLQLQTIAVIPVRNNDLGRVLLDDLAPRASIIELRTWPFPQSLNGTHQRPDHYPSKARAGRIPTQSVSCVALPMASLLARAVPTVDLLQQALATGFSDVVRQPDQLLQPTA